MACTCPPRSFTRRSNWLFVDANGAGQIVRPPCHARAHPPGRRLYYVGRISMIWLSILLFQATAGVTPQIQRGQDLFFAEKGCGTCHTLKGKGTAVGPDLKVLGRVGVRALVTAIRASRTQYVQTVKLK